MINPRIIRPVGVRMPARKRAWTRVKGFLRKFGRTMSRSAETRRA